MSQLLNKLTPLVKKRKRIGRGGSRGGTCGRGHKGQLARTGGASKVRFGFEGGQIPLARRMPKRGFNNKEFTTEYAVVNLNDLERVFDTGTQVTKELLIEKGFCKGFRKPLIKILGNGELSKKFVIYGDAFSKSAIEKIKRCGGEVHLIKEN
jgi:large subunit ribosomal protein L15